ncbi:MAG TPA: hypothetical protein PLX30_09050 [Methanothrix sp.]|nr:hypothetical protein [Methanothrix sp.]
MDSELYDRIARLMLQGWDVDDAISEGMFEPDEIPEVYRLLDREPWGWIDPQEQRERRYKFN